MTPAESAVGTAADVETPQTRTEAGRNGNGYEQMQIPVPREAPPAAPPSVPAGRWRHTHVLDLDDFGRDEIDHVLDTTDAMREVLARDVPRVPALRGTTVATLFYEAS